MIQIPAVEGRQTLLKRYFNVGITPYGGTSSLDTPREKKIQEAISRLEVGRTTFAIAHRLTSLRSADRLVVLDAGKVVETALTRS